MAVQAVSGEAVVGVVLLVLLKGCCVAETEDLEGFEKSW